MSYQQQRVGNQQQQSYQPPRDMSALLDDIEIAPGDARPVLDTMRKLLNYAKWMRASGLCSSSFRSDDQVAIAIQAGKRLGFDELQSVQNIAVVGQQPRLWGAGLMAVINREMGKLVVQFSARWQLNGQDIPEDSIPGLLDAEGSDNVTCVVTHQRKGMCVGQSSYSVEQAKLAGLWWGAAQKAAGRSAEASPWQKNPIDMLRWKARWRAAVADFADILLGMAPAEDALDLIDPTISERAPLQRPRAAIPPPSVEDIPFGQPRNGEAPGAQASEPPAPESAHPEANSANPAGTQDSGGSTPRISEAQLKRFWTIARKAGRSDDEVAAYLTDVWGLASSKDMETKMYDAACAWAEAKA